MPGLDIHAGMWKALHEAGIDSTDCIGTSAGAIISGVDAAGHSSTEFSTFLASLADDDVRHERLFWKARFALIDYFMESDRILKLIRDWTYPSLKPLSVVATRARDGARKDFYFNGSYLDDFSLCILASMSICGVFPKVTIGEEEYVDGGVRANLPLPLNWKEYDEVYLLIASGRPEVYHKETGLLTNLFKNIGWLMQDQILDVLDQSTNASAFGETSPSFGGQYVHVLWPPLNTPKGTLRFDHDLIDQAYQWTASKIAELKTQSRKDSL